jgi:hypothetical protein
MAKCALTNVHVISLGRGKVIESVGIYLFEEKALSTFQKYWTIVRPHHLLFIWDLK